MKLASFCVPLSSQGGNGGMLLPNLDSSITIKYTTDMDDWDYTNPNNDLVKILTTNENHYVTSFTVTSDCWAFVTEITIGGGTNGRDQYWQTMQKGRTYYTFDYNSSYMPIFRIHRNLK